MLKDCSLGFILLCIVLTANAKEIPAHLEGVELYDWLSYEGIYDPEIDNELVNEVLEEALFGDDSDISNAAIGAIGWYVARLRTERWQPLEDDPLADRDLQSIPGFRKFLVESWTEEYEKNPNYIADMTDTDWSNTWEVRNERTVIRLDKVWMTIPGILASLFPKDSDVHDILWKTYDPRQIYQMLSRLEAGEFTTIKATDFRIEVLLNEEAEHFEIATAARGLGLFQSKKGLDALLTRLRNKEEPTTAIAHIVEAIVAHGTKAVPFADLVRSTVERYNLVKSYTMERPAYYNSNHVVGMVYRVQIALRKLKELEESHEDEEP